MRVVVVPVVVSLLVPGAVSTAEAPRGYRLIIQTSLRGAEQEQLLPLNTPVFL